MNSLSVCRISWSRAFTRCWQLLRESLSLSSSPFILALFTICTRMGVSSPSRASKPYKITGGGDRRLTNKHVERCMMAGGNCQPWRRLQLSSEPCPRQTHISSGRVCRCCAAVVNHSLESQHSLLQQKRYTSDEQNQTSFQVFDWTKTDWNLRDATLWKSASHLVLRGTYSGRLFPVPLPAPGQQGSAPPPTSTPAAKTDPPYVCLKTINMSSAMLDLQQCLERGLISPTFLLTWGFGLPMGQVCELHFPVDPREVAIPFIRKMK